MHVTWTFTGDGLITLAVGLLAFLGVVYTVRRSTRDIREQIDAESRTRDEEVSKQRRSLADALAVEIRDFKTFHLDAFIKQSKGEVVKMHGGPSFPVYYANAGRIGDLGVGTGETVIHFYDLAAELLGAEARYREIVDGPCLLGESQNDKEGRQTSFFRDQVLRNLTAARDAAEKALTGLGRATSFSS